MKKVLPSDFLPVVYDSLFVLRQAGQMNFILKTKSLPVLNVENDTLIIILM